VDRPALKPLVVLGATGSIGTQTLEVAARMSVPVVGMAARRGSKELLALATQYPDAAVAVAAPTTRKPSPVSRSQRKLLLVSTVRPVSSSSPWLTTNAEWAAGALMPAECSSGPSSKVRPCPRSGGA